VSEYIELCNHMTRKHGGEPGMWTAKIWPPEDRLPALLRAHERDHAEYLKFTRFRHPMAHDEGDRSQ
jgi:hypothetical protein